ncbi:28S ribosomal protein S29, mitochondrial [Macrosteles quadrilineatus]|uniref:28S ribosomal protein S29, mitochondrial n=1 Tax=Macrosteles quadrilineatus TaxID=74068 RepID=UPI0023E18207|nr:28S ribosomal protein S29, mitochondrial [Macrosteles quadrilineatus]
MTTTLRILRSSLTYQLCCRGLSSEAAVAFNPSKTAVRTSENDPTKQSNQDLAKLYNMPDDVKKRLFLKSDIPMYFERLTDTFCETSIVVRQPALELMDYLKRADYNKPIIRYALYGRFGSGKTLTLQHTLNYAANNGFVIVYLPSVWKWYHWTKEVVPSELDPSVFDLPMAAGSWLKRFAMTNEKLIADLDLKTTKTYQWTPREKAEEGSSLNEMVSFGINRVKYACLVVDALMNELKANACNDQCKVFLAIDGFNGFFQTSSKLKTAERAPFDPTRASLTKIFVEAVKNDWHNGAAVLVIDDHACVKGKYSTHFPFHLLQKEGIETIDPFIPIHVPHYTPLEFNNYLDYLEEKRWLQKPEAREEIEFVTQRNPREITTYCASR